MVSGPKILVIGGLREQMSNRFTYVLGEEERKDLPEKLNTMIMDPLYNYNGLVWVFNEDMYLIKIAETGECEVIEPPEDI